MGIVITAQNGYQLYVEIRDGEVVIKANTTERMHVSKDDARTLKHVLEYLG